MEQSFWFSFFEEMGEDEEEEVEERRVKNVVKATLHICLAHLRMHLTPVPPLRPIGHFPPAFLSP